VIFDADVVQVTIVDVNGKKVYEAESLGGASLSWSGRNERGRMMSSGLYIAELRTREGATRYQKFVIAK